MPGGGDPVSHVRAIIAHGTLMIAAFALFLPLGAVISRHKWMFGRKQGGQLPKSWLYIHMSCQLLGVICALASLILALRMYGDSSNDYLWHPHRIIGIIAVSMLLLQAVMGVLHPQLTNRFRRFWNLFHHNWGRLALGLGICNLFIGSVLVRNLYDQPLWAYAGVALGLVAFFLLLFVVLEPFKMRLQRRDRYNPRTHEVASKGSTIEKQHHAYGDLETDRGYAANDGMYSISNGNYMANNGSTNGPRSGMHSPVFYADGGPARLPADMEVGVLDEEAARK